jgi:S1-C subfamily serine protease
MRYRNVERGKLSRSITFFLTAVAWCLLLPCFSYAEEDFSDFFEQNKTGVVLIASRNSQGVATGTGFVVAKTEGKSYILTNAHVVISQETIVLFAEKEQVNAAGIVAVDTSLDLALLTIGSDELPTFALGEAASLKRGNSVSAAGYPRTDAFVDSGLGISVTLSKGIVSSMRKDERHGGRTLIQIDVPVNPGNSGGPLFNTTTKEVVGVVVSQLRDTQGLNFAISIDDAKLFLQQHNVPYSGSIEPQPATNSGGGGSIEAGDGDATFHAYLAILSFLVLILGVLLFFVIIRRRGKRHRRGRIEPDAPLRRFSLIGGAGNEFILDRAVISVGRRQGNDLVINDSSTSSSHAILEMMPQGILVRDRKSRNGTFVNGKRIVGGLLCRPGDSIQFGNVSFILKELG